MCDFLTYQARATEKTGYPGFVTAWNQAPTDSELSRDITVDPFDLAEAPRDRKQPAHSDAKTSSPPDDANLFVRELVEAPVLP